MNILFFLGLPCPFPGAAWTRVGHFAKTAKDRGHNVKIVGSFLSYRLNKPSKVMWEGIPIYNICPVFGLDSMLTYIVDFVVSMFMLIPILFWRPDAIVISTPPCSPSLGTWLGAKIVGAKIVIDYRDFFITYKISTTKSKLDKKALKVYRRFMSILYQKSDLVVTVTEGTQKILRWLDVFSTVIPNGADTKIFKPISKQNGVFTMIFVCGTVSYYDMIPVLRAMSFLTDLDINFVVIGDFNSIPRRAWINKARNMAKKLGVENSLTILDPITDTEVLAHHIAMADVGIVPINAISTTAKNAYAVKMFEYCSCAIPSIVTIDKNSLMGKMVRENKIGIVVPYGDVIGLSNAIRSLHMGGKMGIQMGWNGRRMVEQNFDRIRNSERFMQLVERM